MKFKIDEIQIEEAHRIAVINVANTLGISDIQKTSTEELVKKIKANDNPLIEPLMTYLQSYDNWAYYYMEHNDDEYFSDSVTSRMLELSTERNHSRDRLGFVNVMFRQKVG